MRIAAVVFSGVLVLGCSPAPRATTPTSDVSAARGRLDPRIIQRVVRADFDAMRACYERGLARKPNLRGRVTTVFVVERDGSVSSPTPTSTSYTPSAPDMPPGQAAPSVAAAAQPLDDEEVSACIALRFGALKFPAPEGGIVKVNYPIIFAPE